MEVMEHKEKGIGKECKNYMVKELVKEFTKDKNMVITSFWHLSSEDVNQLRSSLKKVSSNFLVVKNSIAKRALKESDLEEVAKFIEGGVGIVFGGKDLLTTVKALVDFAKSHEALQIRTGYIEGMIVDKGRIKYIAALPSKKELIARLAIVLNAPISGLANVLSGTLRSLIYVILSYKEKIAKEGG